MPLNVPLHNNFRLILVLKPLHYKLLVTKKRLHAIFLSVFAFFTVELTVGFIFYRQDKFLSANECIALYILQDLAYVVIIMVFFVTISVVMIINYIIITVKLGQRRKEFSTGSSSNSNDINSKVTRACWVALSAFVILYYPSVLLSLATNFMTQPYPVFMQASLDASFLIYYLNNAVNPFIYYATMADFREGYKSLLMCRKVQIGRTNKALTSSIRSISMGMSTL